MFAETVVAGSACAVEMWWCLWQTVGRQMDNICSSKNHIILILLTSLRSHSISIRNPLVMRMGIRVNLVVMLMPPQRSRRRRSRHQPIRVRRRRRDQNSTSRRFCRHRRRCGITFGGTSTGVTVLAVPLLDMEAPIDAELEDNPPPNSS